MIKNTLTIIILLGAFGVMINLGLWQLDRLEWKNNILAKIEKYEAVDAYTTPLNLNMTDDFQKGYIEGRFLNKAPVLIKPRTNDKGAVGYHVILPFKTNNNINIIVNTGWHTGETFPFMALNTKKITGFLRHPDTKNSFTPPNNIEQNRFYNIDINDLEQLYNVDLFDKVLYLDTAFPTMQKPRNKHAQYATFWFFMSGLLIFLCGIFINRQWRHSKLRA